MPDTKIWYGQRRYSILRVRDREDNMYPNYIMEKVRQRLGLESYDTSRDEEINLLPRNNVLDACLEWEGIIGYGYTIRDWIKDVYGVTLE